MATRKGNSLKASMKNLGERQRSQNSEADVSSPKVSTDGMEKEVNSVPPSRQNKKQIMGYFVPEVRKQFKVLSAEEEKTQQELLEEALNDLFVKYGKNPIA